MRQKCSLIAKTTSAERDYWENVMYQNITFKKTSSEASCIKSKWPVVNMIEAKVYHDGKFTGRKGPWHQNVGKKMTCA